jgi:two-component system alkaline phosphatase synthesis response regulator PhoP
MISILIVEDDPSNMRVLGYTLRKAGYEIYTASNGQAALDLMQESIPNLAIIDCAMPIMDGVTLLRFMRANEDYRKIPVIFLTASDDDLENIIVRELSVGKFMNKPISSRTLLSTVQGLLQV